jgi:hypothetical protein
LATTTTSGSTQSPATTTAATASASGGRAPRDADDGAGPLGPGTGRVAVVVT